MSAPDTSIEKQKRRHFTPLVGVGLAVVFGGIMFLLMMFNTVDEAEAPGGTDSEMQGTPPSGAIDVAPGTQPQVVQPNAAQPEGTGEDAETGN